MSEIRPAKLEDVEELVRCNKDNLPVYYDKDEYTYFINDASTFYVLVAIVNNMVIGYLLGEYQDNNNFHILSFAIDENYRRAKAGTKLFNYLLFSNMLKTISLYVHLENKGAIIFYMRTGFRIVEKVDDYYKNLFENPVALRMEYKLNS